MNCTSKAHAANWGKKNMQIFKQDKNPAENENTLSLRAKEGKKKENGNVKGRRLRILNWPYRSQEKDQKLEKNENLGRF